MIDDFSVTGGLGAPGPGVPERYIYCIRTNNTALTLQALIDSFALCITQILSICTNYSDTLVIWVSCKRPFAWLGMVRSDSDGALIATRRTKVCGPWLHGLDSRYRVCLARRRVKLQETPVPRRLCLASKAFWPILRCVDGLCAFEPVAPLSRSRIAGWASWHNQMQHGPFVDLRGEMVLSVGLLLQVRCVAERDAVDGTSGGWQFGRG
ncbi:hypothetical protein B0T18DRAFT_412970 [Schizothecium vesticola]|uniref:Uncharacterized protein n=1 Tax=Schizothecium vesticola TaxID=314040 RepID=A0AA40EWV1_9PEZI|nr:hypothetical protein B0T18DRAFT_412970 [Schizothecium vesticola]